MSLIKRSVIRFSVPGSASIWKKHENRSYLKKGRFCGVWQLAQMIFMFDVFAVHIAPWSKSKPPSMSSTHIEFILMLRSGAE